MSTTVSPAISALYTKLKAFIEYIVPTGTEVARGLNNRVPSPAAPYVLFQMLFQNRLATTVVTYADPGPDDGTASYEQSTRVDIQVDFYGPFSPEWAAMFTTLFRSDFGCTFFGTDCQPLYADEARQISHVTGELQYLERWCVTAVIQWSPVTTTPQEFADTLSADLINVDVAYPP